MKDYLWLIFVIATVVCWGCYVPTLHEGQKLLGGKQGGLRAFVCVGGAYLLVAVVIPVILMAFGVEERSFNQRGVGFAFFGGVLGALGALGIILSIKSGGSPMIIPSLVFAGAPIVNVLFSMAWHRPASAPKWYFFVGMVMAAVGAGLVLYGRPADAPKIADRTPPAVVAEAQPRG